MEGMPRPRPPYLSHERTRHGKLVWYVRREGKRVRVKAEFSTPEFTIEYQAAIAAHQPTAEARTAAGTLAWLIECLRASAAWQARSEATRAKWDGIYRQVIEAAGSAPLSSITPTAGVAAPARRRDAGIRPWTEEDVAAYEKRWSIGTRQRVWLDVLLYTGLRRGAATRLASTI
jgi:hypothetical protein